MDSLKKGLRAWDRAPVPLEDGGGEVRTLPSVLGVHLPAIWLHLTTRRILQTLGPTLRAPGHLSEQLARPSKTQAAPEPRAGEGGAPST